MSSSTGRIIVRQIKKLGLRKEEPSRSFVKQVEAYIPRAESGWLQNSVDATKPTRFNLLRAKSFLERLNPDNN